MTTFSFTLTNHGCPYFYDEGHWCSHESVRARCCRGVCVFLREADTSRHVDSGLRCLMAHEPGHGQGLKCAKCGQWVAPADWNASECEEGGDEG